MPWPAEFESFRVIADYPVFSLVPLPGERLLTLHHQQRRACNLADWLAETAAPVRVAVLGAGLAGLTFSTRYVQIKPEAEVTVFERLTEHLANLRGCRTRWLHPNLFTWPVPGWHLEWTSLPVLQWRAGTAHEVYQLVDKEWTDFRHRNKNLKLRTQASLLRMEPSRAGLSLTFKVAGREDPGKYDALVLAVGPGLEKRVSGALNESYWHDDTLDREHPYEPDLPGAERMHFVVAGNGDGAFTDVCRIRIREFIDHAKLDGIVSAIEQRHANIVPRVEEASRSEGDEAFCAIARELRDRLFSVRDSTSVTMVASASSPGRPEVFPINRLLVAMLRTYDRKNFNYLKRRVAGGGTWIRADRVASDVGRRERSVLFHSPERSHTRGHAAFTDRFVARIGVDRPSVRARHAPEPASELIRALEKHLAGGKDKDAAAVERSACCAVRGVNATLAPLQVPRRLRVRYGGRRELILEDRHRLTFEADRTVLVPQLTTNRLESVNGDALVVEFDRTPEGLEPTRVCLVHTLMAPNTEAARRLEMLLHDRAISILLAGSVVGELDGIQHAWEAWLERLPRRGVVVVVAADAEGSLAADNPFVLGQDPPADCIIL